MDGITNSRVDLDQLEASDLIGHLIRETGLRPSQIAKTAKLSPSTLTRLYPEASVKYTMSLRTLNKLRSSFPEAYASYRTMDHRTIGLPHRVREIGAPFDAGPAILPSNSIEIPFFRWKQAMPAPEDELPKALEYIEIDHGAPTSIWMGSSEGIDSGQVYLGSVPGNGMSPRISAGDVLLIDRVTPAPILSDVLVEFACASGKELLCIAKLIDRDVHSTIIEQSKLQQVETLNSKQVKNVFRVSGRFDELALPHIFSKA